MISCIILCSCPVLRYVPLSLFFCHIRFALIFQKKERKTFENVLSWKRKIMAEREDVPVIMIGNKADTSRYYCFRFSTLALNTTCFSLPCTPDLSCFSSRQKKKKRGEFRRRSHLCQRKQYEVHVRICLLFLVVAKKITNINHIFRILKP